MGSEKIPDIVISRLPIYLRGLTRLQSEGEQKTSSKQLGLLLGITPAQIRKDLSHFDRFGKQGMGYDIHKLVGELRHILKVEREWDVALVGAGAMGHALAFYNGFTDHGFRIRLIFDSDPAKIGTPINGLEVCDVAQLSTLIQQQNITLAMVAVPPEAAQTVTDELVKAGVRGILNYAPIKLSTPENVRVQDIDPVVHLQHITYYFY